MGSVIHVQTEMQQEHAENRDIDVLMQVSQSKRSRIFGRVFDIGNILCNITSYLTIPEIIKLHGVNKLLNNELTFGFKCKNFNIFFIIKINILLIL